MTFVSVHFGKQSMLPYDVGKGSGDHMGIEVVSQN